MAQCDACYLYRCNCHSDPKLFERRKREREELEEEEAERERDRKKGSW